MSAGKHQLPFKILFSFCLFRILNIKQNTKVDFFQLNHSLFCSRASVSHRQKIKTKLRTEFDLDNSFERKKSKTFCNPTTERVSEETSQSATEGPLICRSISRIEMEKKYSEIENDHQKPDACVSAFGENIDHIATIHSYIKDENNFTDTEF